MKMFLIKNNRDNKVCGRFESKSQAVESMMDFITDHNDELDNDEQDAEYLTPFDFKMEEVEATDVHKFIPDYEAAKNFLGKSPINCKITGVMEKHADALVALNALFTIAEAWNKADNFTPDWSNRDQCKWYPWFVYDADRAGFVFAYTSFAPSYSFALIGSRLCFKSSNRARQFGEQFIDLWNRVLLIK